MANEKLGTIDKTTGRGNADARTLFITRDGGALDSALDANSQRINNLLAPGADGDAANRKYVDDSITPFITYTLSVVDADLTANKITVTHSLSTNYPIVQVYNNTKQLSVMGVTSIDSNTVEVDFTGYTPLTGTWQIIIKR